MRIYVLKTASTSEVAIAELVAMLEAAGLEVIVIETLPEPLSPDVTVVVVMTEDCDADGDLMSAAEAIGRAGARIIGVWPKDHASENVASPIDWHGAAAVSWDPKKICDAIAGETIWETPKGEKRTAPHVDRNKC